jgi:UDP-N-acetylglucosamine--N-acetylmuramyl-(pentapeptide) pyrophosphoryl-undecaprenol N-acetylglucosamine transferase
MARAFDERRVRAVLGMGGYVTIPAAWAGRRVGARVAVAEQNAEAGLANSVVSRIADSAFGAFPSTARMPKAQWVGNPVRASLSRFDRDVIRPGAMQSYGLDPETPVLGVFGGSLGAGVINRAVVELAGTWDGPPIQILHLAGDQHAAELSANAAQAPVTWRVVGFEEQMDRFYAACDLIVARAGGAVAELALTRTPAILIPGGFGSGAHQEANAAAFAEVGGAVVISEAEVHRLPAVVGELVADPGRRTRMAGCLGALAKPDAADVIAACMEELHG